MLSSFNRSNLAILLCSLFLAVSCEEPVDLDAENENQIVVQSHFTPGQYFKVFLSKSRLVNSPDAEEFIDNATVQILNEDGKAIENLMIYKGDRPFYKSGRIMPLAGVNYKLEVAIPGEEIIISDNTAPMPVRLEQFSVDTLETNNNGQMVYSIEINVGFDDPMEEENFYHLSLYTQVSDEGRSKPSGFDEIDEDYIPLAPIESDVNNPSVTFHYQDGLLFSDESFQGETANLTFLSLLDLSNPEHNGQITGKLRTVSKDYYLYHTSLSRQIETKDRPFAEPVSVYSNIENAIGIFAGYSEYSDSTTISQ